jgi:hypothetical protein
MKPENRMTNVVEFYHDRIEQMQGPKRGGHDVFIEDRLVPNVHMYDNGSHIDFVLDGRLIFTFPREIAVHAMTFAAHAMAIGAGHPSLSAPHGSSLPYGTPVIGLTAIPKD